MRGTLVGVTTQETESVNDKGKRKRGGLISVRVVLSVPNNGFCNIEMCVCVCMCGMKEREIERGCVLRRYCMKECILDRQTERGIFGVVGTYVPMC